MHVVVLPSFFLSFLFCAPPSPPPPKKKNFLFLSSASVQATWITTIQQRRDLHQLLRLLGFYLIRPKKAENMEAERDHAAQQYSRDIELDGIDVGVVGRT